MAKLRSQMPGSHGELVLRPALEELPALVSANARISESWEFEVGGIPAQQLRRDVRKALASEAAAVTARLGLDVPAVPVELESVVVTGHQPELYHTGIWVKSFLLQRICEMTGATGVDLVVDSDVFDSVDLTAPCLIPYVRRCRHRLSSGSDERCFACAPVPSARDIDEFCEATSQTLASLPDPSIGRNFARFCDSLREAATRSSNLSELLTGARRRFEGGLTGYLELPVTVAAGTEPFLCFAASILLEAKRFAVTHNEELAVHRRKHRVRSAAHPFPDLAAAGDSVEVPFWLLADGRRSPARVRSVPEGVELIGPDGPITVLPPDPREAVISLLDEPVILAPRALALTLFTRAFFADLFIHGIGGERYDRVTDAIAKRWWGIDLPPFAVVSLSMSLPLRADAVTDDDITAIERRLHRLEHNPDEALGEVEFDSPAEEQAAVSLAERKRQLVEAIRLPGADKKALGERIRAVNAELAGVLKPLVEQLVEHKERLGYRRLESEIMTDRTYPFCFWNAVDIADKVR